ncbi:hypothetical protein K440DRAFT_646640 [Wilcoxina mikolae CBS 423.85]|nr:hypothetical protein K440DRAFT_646640 [Wilcoxina mikolae CBS 423.85]
MIVNKAETMSTTFTKNQIFDNVAFTILTLGPIAIFFLVSCITHLHRHRRIYDIKIHDAKIIRKDKQFFEMQSRHISYPKRPALDALIHVFAALFAWVVTIPTRIAALSTRVIDEDDLFTPRQCYGVAIAPIPIMCLVQLLFSMCTSCSAEPIRYYATKFPGLDLNRPFPATGNARDVCPVPTNSDVAGVIVRVLVHLDVLPSPFDSFLSSLGS